MELFLRELSQKILGKDSDSYAQAGKLLICDLKCIFQEKQLTKYNSYRQ